MAKYKMKHSSKKKWFETYTKKSLSVILFFSILDLQLSYVLAFMGKEQIAESLSSTIASTIIGVMIGYFFKSVTETYLERREERLANEFEQREG